MLRTFALLMTVVSFPAPFAVAQDANMIAVGGGPKKIGATWGELNRDRIVHDVEVSYLKRAADTGISKETLVERSAAGQRIIEEYAPHWLKEGRAIARAAGVDEDLYLAFMDGQSRGRFLHEDTETPGKPLVECTSYAVSRDHAKDNAILFHKTRDNKDNPQAAVIVDSSLKGINKFIAITGASAIRCSMMVNEKGLAGSGDYPADKKKDSSTLHLEPAPHQYRGVMAGTILRYIAERASTSAEALAIIEEFVKKGYYAGGDVGGSHWLFVDREGTILEVWNNPLHVASMVHTEKVYFSRFNKCEQIQRLRDAEVVDFHMFHNIAREKPLLTKESISGLTVEIDPDYPELLTCAWISLPVRAVAFPVFMGQRATPEPLLNGSAYALGKAAPSRTPRWEELERVMHAEKEEITKEIRAGILAKKTDRACVERVEQWSAQQAGKLVVALKQSE